VRTITRYLAASLVIVGTAGAAAASECPGNPQALGTVRSLTLDPAVQNRVGTIQYLRSLPLREREVVLTFDNGPTQSFTGQILDALAHECVKGTFFLVGRSARNHPDLVKRLYAEGHVVGTQTHSRPERLDRLPILAAQHEIDLGITAIADALGSLGALAPFFRFPGLHRSETLEEVLRVREIAVWSADIVGKDSKEATAEDVAEWLMAQLAERGKGIILLRDGEATTETLPVLLRRLRESGYQTVRVVPPGYDAALAASMAADLKAASMSLERPAGAPADAATGDPVTTPLPPPLRGLTGRMDRAIPEALALPVPAPDHAERQPAPPLTPMAVAEAPATPTEPPSLTTDVSRVPAQPAWAAPVEPEPGMLTAIPTPRPGPSVDTPRPDRTPDHAADAAPLVTPLAPDEPAATATIESERATPKAPAQTARRVLVIVPGPTLDAPGSGVSTASMPFTPMPMPSQLIGTAVKLTGPSG